MTGEISRNWLVSVLLPVLILTGLVILFFNKMVFSNLILARGDTFLYFFPYWNAAAAALRSGRVPLWNPAIFMGVPFLANSQVGFFYPLNWPLWWLLDTPYAVNASIILHLLIASFGAYLVGRRLFAFIQSAALVAALSFALGGYLTAQVEHINQVQGLAWLPWFILAIGWPKLAGWQSWLQTTLAIGILFALQLLAGHTQTTFITAVALLLWILADGLGRRFLPINHANNHSQGEDNFLLRLVALAGGGLLALALTAVQVVPTLELIGNSSRQGGLPVNEVLSFSLPPQHLARSILPAYGQQLFSEYIAFLPLTILALALIGGWQWRTRSGVLPALTLTIGGLFLAFGAYNPLYWLLARLPLFSAFRAPARWLVLYALGLSLLAGLGWHLLWGLTGENARPADKRLAWRHKVAPPLILFFVFVILLSMWGFTAGYLDNLLPGGAEAPYEAPSGSTVSGWIVEALLIGLLFTTAAYSDRSGLDRIPLSGLLVVSLTAAFFASRSLPYNNLTTPEAYADLRPSTSRLLAISGDPPQRLLSLSDIFFDPGDQAEIDSIYTDQLPEQARYDYTIAIKQKEINAPNLPMITGLASVDGFDGGVLPLRSYSQLMSLILPAGEETADGRLREHLSAVPEPRWLDLFNARYLITDKTGDLWQDGVFFDRQHPVILAPGESVSVSYVPNYEATEIRMLASARPHSVHIVTQSGEDWTLEVESITESQFRAPLPRSAILVEIIVDSCQESPACILEAVTLVDTRDSTFHSLVPGNYRLIHSGDVKIYENSDVLDRAFLVHNWQKVVNVETAISLMGDPGFDVRASAVIITDQSVLPEPDQPASGFEDRVEIERYTPEHVVLRTNSDADGLLVLTDAYYPGWQASVDGESATILQTDALFRGVFIPAGEHEITFRFDLPTYRTGLSLTLFILVPILLLIALFIIGRYRGNFLASRESTE